jgi:hypothetical protein
VRIRANTKLSIASLRQFTKRGEQRIKGEILRMVKAVAKRARQLAPEAEGKLKRSITHKVIRDGREGQVVADRRYASFVEYGRPPGGFPPERPIRRWVRIKKIPQSWGVSEDAATFLVRRKIAREGTDPQPFIGPAWESEIRQHRKNMRRILRENRRRRLG